MHWNQLCYSNFSFWLMEQFGLEDLWIRSTMSGFVWFWLLKWYNFHLILNTRNNFSDFYRKFCKETVGHSEVAWLSVTWDQIASGFSFLLQPFVVSWLKYQINTSMGLMITITNGYIKNLWTLWFISKVTNISLFVF